MADKEKSRKRPILPRGREFTGVVVSVNPHKTAVAEWERWRFAEKYERFEKKRTRVSVHNPEEISAEKGDMVMIRECRPLSKTKKFIITKKLGKEELFAERERLMEESKTKSRKEKKEDEAEERLRVIAQNGNNVKFFPKLYFTKKSEKVCILAIFHV